MSNIRISQGDLVGGEVGDYYCQRKMHLPINNNSNGDDNHHHRHNNNNNFNLSDHLQILREANVYFQYFYSSFLCLSNCFRCGLPK